MAIELKFSKSDNDTPWGFRLVGGADFDQPLVVVKVNKNSLAEQAGLEVGDLVVRINDTPTAGLSHAESHELLSSVGREFILAIRRGVFSSDIIGSADYENEFEKLVQEVEESLEKNIIEVAVARIEAENIKNLEISLSENLAGQEEMVYISETPRPKTFTETLTHGIKTDKKWSTFLMKPDKPIPQPNKKVEEEKSKGETYKVVIKKQRGNRPYLPQQPKKVQFDQNVIQVDLSPDDEEENLNDELNEREENVEDLVTPEEHPEYDGDKPRESPEGTDGVKKEYETDELNNSENDQDFDDSLEQEFEIIEYKPLSEIRIETGSETPTTLEEQLKAVQKQLQALSELPSAVQVTLDAVSKQLADLVGGKEEKEELDDGTGKETSEVDDDTKKLEECHGEGSVSEKALAEDELADTNSSFGEDLEEDIITDEIKAIMERFEEESDDNEIEVLEESTEQALEAKILEEERLAKEQNAEEDRPRKMERPIVLPGGRKWIDPDDVVPKRKSKMTEQQMTEAIDNSLEVIAGKRKGINFLKYDPPPKNLEYLQRSETYRLIHGMETETRGITARPETVPAIQDYYEATLRGPV